ncbi:surface carbohydrate biosynthesis protein [Halobacterium salinarum]|uniref:surface carbohydrate biosynthesis protein n=1 Tax=Halobacterium salinarum TaxID=2242 RepID=UPI002556268F|nr:surface carbohydrate biosynthesis protein [Halobacterium salinarum]MDL0132506.1 hypothetical protein [Halobacterium salinarum]
MKIALPIETKVREFRGKLWLALNLVENGHEVVIGNISSINNGLDTIEPHIYFGDSAYYRPNREELYRQIQESGGTVIVIDTEGGVFRSAEAYKKRLSPKILRYVDYFFAWGERPAEIARQASGLQDERVRVTGNPRFDLLQPDLREIYRTSSNNYRNRYGKYILVNTNFTYTNPFDKGNIETEDDDKIAYQEDLWKQFTNAIESLANDISDYNYIIRPHPSEDHDWYRNEFRPYDNVFVRYEGDVRSWIYEAIAVIHNSCTTGIESALMNTPVFSYRPVQNQDYDLELPNIVSAEVTEYSKLQERILQTSVEESGYEMREDQKERLQQYFDNVDKRSVEQITSVIETQNDLAQSSVEFPSKVPSKQLVKRVSTALIGIQTTEEILQRLTHRDYSYMRQKFPGLSIEEVREEIRQFQNIAQAPAISVSKNRALGDVFTLTHDSN